MSDGVGTALLSAVMCSALQRQTTTAMASIHVSISHVRTACSTLLVILLWRPVPAVGGTALGVCEGSGLVVHGLAGGARDAVHAPHPCRHPAQPLRSSGQPPVCVTHRLAVLAI